MSIISMSIFAKVFFSNSNNNILTFVNVFHNQRQQYEQQQQQDDNNNPAGIAFHNAILQNNSIIDDNVVKVIVIRSKDLKYKTSNLHKLFDPNKICNIVSDTIDMEKTTMNNNDNNNNNNTRIAIIFDIEFGCQQLFDLSIGGNGNWLMQYYIIRMTMHIINDNVSTYIHCYDAIESSHYTVMPWLTGYFPSRYDLLHIQQQHSTSMLVKEIAKNFYDNPMNLYDRCCTNDYTILKEFVGIMKLELRRMAFGLLGIPLQYNNNNADYDNALTITTTRTDNYNDYASQYLQHTNNDYRNKTGAIFAIPINLSQPLIDDNNSIHLDDTVIHFRCGDLAIVGHYDYYFLKYRYYANLIPNNTQSIGIVTQPFIVNSINSRKYDFIKKSGQRCKILVNGMVDYLQQYFPNATIHIHNGPTESIALSTARMIFATTLITSVSSFSIIAGLVSFANNVYIPKNGVGYIKWLMIPPYIDDQSIHITNEAIKLNSLDMAAIWKIEPKNSGEKCILEWFHNDTYKLKLPNIDFQTIYNHPGGSRAITDWFLNKTKSLGKKWMNITRSVDTFV